MFRFESSRSGRLLASTCLALALGAGLTLATPLPIQAYDAPASFSDLVEAVSPSVVNITTSAVISTPAMPMPRFPPGNPFGDFFDQFNGPEGDAQQRSEALGTGFLISKDGYVVTNAHVIEQADEITVELYSGKKLAAKVIGVDPKTDIALLKVEAEEPLPFTSFGDSDKMRVGDWVVAVGNPMGQGFSVSAGIVSARNRELSGTYDDYLQTDAAINRGNSGGPLFNTDGQVIGVNTAILSPNGGSIGIGFSMASNVVEKVVDQLREFGETRRGWLGVRIQDVTDDIAESLGLADAKGALVTDVPEGPARDAGIKAGDIIQKFGGEDIASASALTRQVADTPEGESVPVIVLRDGKKETLEVKLGRREVAEGTASVEGAQSGGEEAGILGLTLKPLDDEMRDRMGLDRGTGGLVVVDIDAASDAWSKGLRRGDVIVQAGQQNVANPADLTARLEEAKEAGRKSLLLLVRRGGDPIFIALPVE